MNFKRRKRHSNAYSSGSGAQPCPDPLSNTASYENPKSSFRLPFRFCFILRQAYPVYARLTYLLSPSAGGQKNEQGVSPTLRAVQELFQISLNHAAPPAGHTLAHTQHSQYPILAFRVYSICQKECFITFILFPQELFATQQETIYLV